jgi:hypothetical protein
VEANRVVDRIFFDYLKGCKVKGNDAILAIDHASL